MNDRLTPKEVEALVLKTLLQWADKGSDSIRKRLKQLEGANATGPEAVTVGSFAGIATVDGKYLGDAVVNTITSLNRFLYAREIVDLLRDHPAIASEPDVRYKRRKVSQALYANKDERIISRKFRNLTVWGLPGWVDEHDSMRADYIPSIPTDDDKNERTYAKPRSSTE